MKIPIGMLTLMLGLNVRKFMLVLFALLLFVSASLALAEERSFTKDDTPSPVLVLSIEGVGLANFYANSLDFPSGTLPDPKELLEIAWRTTYYPESANSKVELCYFRPYSSQPNCVDIAPNSSGVIYEFNAQSFNHESRVVIKHYVLGGTPPYSRPAGVDTVTFRYRY